ncbi:MAG: Hsp20/alpha crystallin family protein [Gemmatimonadota bacterium]
MTGWPFPTEDSERSRLRDELASLLGGAATAGAGVFPAVNIYDDGQSFLLRAELPGMDKDSLDITLRGEQVVVRGERRPTAPDATASFHRRERESGHFRRVVTLPERVEAGRVEATYTDGVLEIVLPRVPEAQPRKVRVS